MRPQRGRTLLVSLPAKLHVTAERLDVDVAAAAADGGPEFLCGGVILARRLDGIPVDAAAEGRGTQLCGSVGRQLELDVTAPRVDVDLAVARGAAGDLS